MKLFISLAIIALTIFGCDNSKQIEKRKRFKQFDFSYNNLFATCFSIKFTQGDTVFIRQHFAPISDTLKRNQNYFAILTDTERQKLDSFLDKAKFASYDTSYYQSYEDGDYYQFYIANDTMQKTIFVHSDSIPTELKEFGYWIVATKKNLKHYLAVTTTEFGSLKYFLPPVVDPPPTIKFKPPKVE
jgi:hypothetical protein